VCTRYYDLLSPLFARCLVTRRRELGSTGWERANENEHTGPCQGTHPIPMSPRGNSIPMLQTREWKIQVQTSKDCRLPIRPASILRWRSWPHHDPRLALGAQPVPGAFGKDPDHTATGRNAGPGTNDFRCSGCGRYFNTKSELSTHEGECRLAKESAL
jgi:hypothetical protein